MIKLRAPAWYHGLGRSLTVAAVCVAALPSDLTQAPMAGPPGVQSAAPARRPFRGFIQNQGQWATAARFVADFDDLSVRAEPGAIVVQRKEQIDDLTRLGIVRLVFEEVGETALPHGGNRAPGEFHYFYGKDPAQWRRNVPAYNEIVYSNVAPGTDVRLSQRDGRFEYDVLLSASAELGEFVMRCEGIDGLSLENNGDLRMDTPLGPLVQHAPRAWQVAAGGQVIPATCTFQVLDGQRFGLKVPDREANSSLVIDPGLTWASFLGGSAGDYAVKVRALANRDVLVVERSASPDFPTTAGVFATTSAGSTDITVSCMDPSGTALVFSTYVGGSAVDVPESLAVSSEGAIAVSGYTNSTDYPTLPNAYGVAFGGGLWDAFAFVLSPDGKDLVFSTLMGGACQESFNGVGFSSRGLIVAGGSTCSPTFQTTPSAFDTSFGSQADGVVCWFDPLQSGQAQLVCSSFLGSTGDDQVLGLTMGPGDEPIVVGSSTSTDFPTTPGVYDETPGGNFITRFAADGASVAASTHFKGGNPYLVALDVGSVVIAGNPSSSFTATPNAFDTTWNGHLDGFVARLDDQLDQLLSATYIGGSLHDVPRGLAIDASGGIVIAGYTESDNYPTTPGAYDTVKGGPFGSVTSMVSFLSADLSQLLYSSFLGPAGSTSSWANDVAALGPADVVIVGEGALPGFPVTPGAFDETFNGGTLGGADGYVARMLLEPPIWIPLGGAVAGSNGTPSLAGSGGLVGGQPVSLALTSAKSATSATLIIGLSQLGLPFKGGTLVPNPNFLIFGLPTNGHGNLTLSATWPPGLPSGFTFYTQYWIPDSAGPAGFAASNGLSGTTP